MLPALLKVTVADQLALLGLPLPPAPSQPLAQRKLVTAPGSERALCRPPPLLRKVTVSPTAISKSLGEKLAPEVTTVWFAAPAMAGNKANQSARLKRNFMALLRGGRLGLTRPPTHAQPFARKSSVANLTPAKQRLPPPPLTGCG